MTKTNRIIRHFGEQTDDLVDRVLEYLNTIAARIDELAAEQSNLQDEINSVRESLKNYDELECAIQEHDTWVREIRGCFQIVMGHTNRTDAQIEGLQLAVDRIRGGLALPEGEQQDVGNEATE